MELGYRLTPDERENIRAQFSRVEYFFQRTWQFVFGILLLFGIVLVVLRVLRFPFRALFRKRVVAQIRTTSIEPSIGASWYWWTYVTFYVPGRDTEPAGARQRKSKQPRHSKDIKLRLYPGQAVRFVIDETNNEGDRGQLTYFGKRLLNWKLLERRESEQFQVFLSYPHEKKAEAAFIADLFDAEMLHVWMDKDNLRAGDSLPENVASAIESSSCFVPLLCPEYMSSEWCLKELREAAERYPKTMIRPIQLDRASFFIPEFVSQKLKKAGDPVFANIDEQSGLDQVRRLARRIYDEARHQSVS